MNSGTELEITSGVTVSISGITVDPASRTMTAINLNGGSLDAAGITVTSYDVDVSVENGGSLIVRGSTIDGSTVPGEAAISITGGTVDLGTSTSPGGNTINISSGDEFVQNLTGNPVPTVGDTFTVDGTTQLATELSFTTLASSLDPSVFGQSVTFTAAVTPDYAGDPTPTGTVSFIEETTGTTLATVTLSAGTATFTTAALGTGTSSIVASYSGDTRYLLSLDQAPQTVYQDGTTTSVASSLNPSTYGQSVTFTAAVSASSPGSGTPTGTVTFYDGTTSIGTGTLSGGKATLKTSTLPGGTDSITVGYGGDTNFLASTSARWPRPSTGMGRRPSSRPPRIHRSMARR